MDNKKIINECLSGCLKDGVRYHSILPEDLSNWYCYTIDGGHSILTILKTHFSEGMVYTDYLIPCPVKAVLDAGYEMENGFIVVDLPYSTDTGLITDPKFDEF